MKKNGVFQGIILIGFGFYFLIQQLQLLTFKDFLTWQTLLIVIGLAFLFQAYMCKSYPYILPGLLLFGFGIYFHNNEIFAFIPKGISSILLIISIGVILQYQKTKTGLAQGLLLLAFSLLFYSYDQFTKWIQSLGDGIYKIFHYWPIILILLGSYYLFFKKK